MSTTAFREIAPKTDRPLSPVKLLCKFLFLVVSFEVIFSVPYRSVNLVTHSSKGWLAAIACCVVAAAAFGMRRRLVSISEQAIDLISPYRRIWVYVWLGFGLLIRLAWAFGYHIALKSDGLAYFTGAQSLAQTHSYPGAYWPPGFSLYLAPFFMLFGAHVWVTVLCSLISFTGLYLLTYRTGLMLGGPKTAALAAFLVAIWPTDIAATSANVKETFLGLCVSAIALLFLYAVQSRRPHSFRYLFAAGVLTGLCTLTQPGFILFPAILFLAWILYTRDLWSGIRCGAIILAATLLTMSPWTYRNYRVLHLFVPVSVNGGQVFYGANNPNANAAYMSEADLSLPANEVVANKEGYRLGLQWVKENPGGFLQLAVRRQVTFLGDDGIGPYETMKRGLDPPRRFYAMAKMLCNLYWMGLWFILLVGSSKLFSFSDWPLWFGVCLLPLIYQWLIDSVFISGGRHHLSYIGLVSIVAAMALLRPEAKRFEA